MVQLDNLLIFMAIGTGVLIMMNNYRIYEHGSSIVDLKYHNHGPAAPGLPRDSDGELIHTLDGVRGWY